MDDRAAVCLICKNGTLTDIATPLVRGVTSDSKPWPRLGQFCICEKCGHIQKRLTQSWLDDIKRIYDAYEFFPLSDYSEQFIMVNGKTVSRNSVLVSFLEKHYPIAARGKILDIGCGNGRFLRTFGVNHKGWRLYGCEQSSSFREEVMGITNVVNFYDTDIADLDEKFDCITMIYVIEHLLDPVKTLQTIRSLLSDGGFVYITTADMRANPFDLAVVDHCSHFTLEMLACVARQAGFSVVISFDDCVDKEIGIIATPSLSEVASDAPPLALEAVKTIFNKNLTVLQSLVDAASNITDKTSLGVFGTAIAGTWLANTLGDKVAFFIDEDVSKAGKRHLDIVVHDMASTPLNSTVLLPFPKKIIKKILPRVQRLRPDLTFLSASCG